MVNPSIAIAAGSYAGSMNIGEPFVSSGLRSVAAGPPKLMRYSAQRYANASDQRRG